MEIWVLVIVMGLCSANSVERKIYVNLNTTAPCVRLMNATHQIGCQSSLNGDTGVVHLVEQESDLNWALRDGPNPPYMVLLESEMFKRDVMLRLKAARRVTGVAVLIPAGPLSKQFSAAETCPNDKYGLYSDHYGPEFAHCNGSLWNPDGNGLSYEEFPFPIFMLKDENETRVIRQCFYDHNQPVNGTAPDFPLCAMQLSAHMHGVKDTVTCMRRSAAQLTITLNPEVVCDPLSDYNIWGVTRPVNQSDRAQPDDRFVIAATRLDSRSFFWDVAPGADSTVSGFVSLLAAADALARLPEVRGLPKNIMFVFFQGETFDYIGSSRLVFDMKKGKFPIGLQNIESFIELNQVGIQTNSTIWAHTDPISLRNTTVRLKVQELLESLSNATTGTDTSVREPGRTQPLPPSSFQRFLRERNVPGTVLTDHEGRFSNRYYQSVYDLRQTIRLEYPNDLTPEEALNYVTDTARTLADVGSIVARTLYSQAGGNGNLDRINADPSTVARMLYGFLIQSNNSWFRSILSPDMQSVLDQDQLTYYVSVNSPVTPTRIVRHVLANLTGTPTNLTEKQCVNADQRPADRRDFYDFLWIQGWDSANSTGPSPYCLQSPVWLLKAESPAFELRDWASTEYSTWTESRWKGISGRIFLVASKELEIITLVTGVAILFTSLLLIYFINAKANILFTSREPGTSMY